MNSGDGVGRYRPTAPPESVPFPRACITTPHYLATLAGHEVLASGGNAVDAAVAANVALGVVAPYRCGFGGDLVAMIWDGGTAHGYLGIGRAGSLAEVATVAERSADPARMPFDGPLTVTVPGAVQGWFDVVERFGTRSFAALAERAAELAGAGFTVTNHGARIVAAGLTRFADRAELRSVYDGVRPGAVLAQPGLAATIAALSQDGPGAFYRGPVGEAVVRGLAERGGLLTAADLDRHRGRWVAPLRGRFRGHDVVEMPPPTQGATALLALAIAELVPETPAGTPVRHHVLIEVVKRAMADRDMLAADPDVAQAHLARILDPGWVAARAGEIDPQRAGVPRAMQPAGGGTACVLAADGDGRIACLVQSNLAGFGSGETIAPWGINLHNRGMAFTLDPSSPRAVGPGREPLHTLVPALVLRDDRPVMALAASGGDGQFQTQLAVLTSVLDDGVDPARALADPRWLVSPDDGSVAVEDRLGDAVVAGLRDRGHVVQVGGYGEIRFGCGHALLVSPDAIHGAADPRCEGLVAGL
jgi:gamma-glutamyltranspeptidase/glutathione hydrolase